MKKTIITLMLLLCGAAMYASEPVITDSVKVERKVLRDGNTFKYEETTRNNTVSCTETEYEWQEKESDKYVTYKIWITPKGKAFILKTSKKTGNQYRKYLPDYVYQQIKK